MKVGDVVRLTEHGAEIAKHEFEQNWPKGSTAVIKSTIEDGPGTNHEYIIEFFAWPGDEWGFFEGEIESASRG